MSLSVQSEPAVSPPFSGLQSSPEGSHCLQQQTGFSARGGGTAETLDRAGESVGRSVCLSLSFCLPVCQSLSVCMSVCLCLLVIRKITFKKRLYPLRAEHV